MFDDDFMNDMLLNPDLYGMEDEEDKKRFGSDFDEDDEDEDDD